MIIITRFPACASFKEPGTLQHPSDLFFPIVNTLVQASAFLAKISFFVTLSEMY